MKIIIKNTCVIELISISLHYQIKTNKMKAQDLKVGSEIQIISNLSTEKMNVPMIVKIDRVSDNYVWFKYSGFQRVGINTINKYPELYKIISIN